MNKNVGLVVIPFETLRYMAYSPEDAKNALLLPEGVKVFKQYEDYYSLTYNIILISDEPVEGVTLTTAPGCHVPRTTHEVTPDGKFKVGV